MGENQQADAPMIVEASAAAKQLGVSASGIRRLLVIYETAHGPLPRSGPKRMDPRILTLEVVERLGAARQLVEAERFKSIAEALQALEAGLKPDITIADTLDVAARDLSGEALGLLLEELQGIRSELAELRPVRGEVQALREEVSTLKALPAPAAVPEPETQHGLLVRFALWLEGRFRG